MQIITHNLAAMNASRQLKITTNSQKKSSEKLSSGYRINRAADDAAGLTISEKMRAQIRGLNRGAENVEDGISFSQVADGALNEVQSMLQRMNELAVQSVNGTNSESDRQAIDDEMQQLKREMERIFTTTTFNEKQVWPEESIVRTPVFAGKIQVQAVTVTTPSSQDLEITNAFYDKIASSGYKITADAQGVGLSWTDYDGDKHTTTQVSWDELKDNGYSFQIADYFDATDTALFDAGGNPLFDFTISLSVAKESTTDDIIAAINDTTMSASVGAWISGKFEDSAGNQVVAPGVSIGTSINYSAAYASRDKGIANGELGYDFDAAQDTFVEAVPKTASGGNMISGPNVTAVDTARTNNETWSFAFEMDGIGELTATSSSITYYSDDRRADTEGIWWEYYTYPDGSQIKIGKGLSSNAQGNGTLGSVMDCLKGDGDSSTPGLLISEGVSTSGGTIALHFDLTSASGFSYGDGQTSNQVGSITLYISISNTDTEQTVLDKINNALNQNTILDLQTSTSDATGAYQTVWSSSEKPSLVERDVYRDDLYYGNVNRNIHAGPSTRDKIYLNYKCLRTAGIGLKDTNVLTEDASMDALDEVANAIKLISAERSLFGAYQNRMEYAKRIDENTAENTTAAESRIRDTDMAEEMVEFSKENILMQAGQAMLAQANASVEGVLSLLSD